MEINIFNPGDLQMAERLYGVHFAREIVRLLERKVEYLRQYRESSTTLPMPESRKCHKLINFKRISQNNPFNWAI